MGWARALGLAFALLWAGTLAGQGRPEVPRDLRPFVSVFDPVVDLRHVRLADGTGARFPP